MKYKKNDLIKYRWIYSDEEYSVGIIVKTKNDLNFGSILHIFNNSNVESIPERMIKIERLNNEHKSTYL